MSMAGSTLPLFPAESAPRPRREIWALGGGKGGIGKSLLTAALGWQMARMGRRVVLLDADLGGANLHTCFGLPPPARSLDDLIQRRVERLEDVLAETGTPGLRLISGADFLGAANIKYQQKVRLLARIRALEVDVILMDLGAGTSFNTLDFFLAADVGLLAVVPEPTSIENAYRFVKSALYRRLHGAWANQSVRFLIESALDPRDPHGVRTPPELLAAIAREDPEASEPLRREMARFQPRFIVNQVRSEADLKVGHQLVAACIRHLGVRAGYAGCVPYDDAVWQGVRHRRLFMTEAPDSAAARGIRQLAHGLVDGQNLPLW